MEKSTKQRKVVLSIEDKLEVIKMLKEGTSYTLIAEKFSIGRSTIADIKKSESKLLDYKTKMATMGINAGKAKVMKTGNYELVDAALYIWFRQQRENNVPVSGAILKEKAKLLFEQLYPDSPKEFCASTGYQWRFSKRHGIKSISIQGEQGSADIISACDFQFHFDSMINGYSNDQIFNCDETGLQFRLLPQKTLASVFEKRAEGRKKAKDRVTINACANVTGNIKLPLLFIGKAARPRCFQHTNLANLPVVYMSQKNAWVNTRILDSWFHNHFVPFIQNKLTLMGQEPKAILVLDNCAAHPDEDKLVSNDGKVKALFLPPNVTSLIQPMDQGVLEALKRRYRKSLLRDILLSSEELDIANFLRGVNMKVVVEKVAIAWDEISPVTIRRSWRKLIPISSPTPAPEASSASSQTAPTDVDPPNDHNPSTSDFIEDFSRLGKEFSEEEIQHWLEADASDQGYEHLDDAGIIQHVLQQAEGRNNEGDGDGESDEEEEQPIVPQCVSHKAVVEMFDKCIEWLHCQPEATPYNTSVLVSLKELAAKKRFSSLRQTNLMSFIENNN